MKKFFSEAARRLLLALLILLSILRSASGAPCRIVSLAPSGTEILFALGQGEKIIGVTNFCDYPPEAKTKPQVAGFTEVNLEALVSTGADLVILQNLHRGTLAPQLERLKIPFYVLEQESVEDILTGVRGLGELCGVREAAQKLTDGIRSDLTAVARTVEGRPRPRVLLAVSRELSEPRIDTLYIAGQRNFYDELIRLAGGVNASEETAVAYPRISREGLLKLNPDAILDLVGDPESRHSTGGASNPDAFDPQRLLSQWKQIVGLKAVEEGRVGILFGTLCLRPGPRVAEIVKIFAGRIHPESFGGKN